MTSPFTKYPAKWNSIEGNEYIQTHRGDTPENLIGKFNDTHHSTNCFHDRFFITWSQKFDIFSNYLHTITFTSKRILKFQIRAVFRDKFRLITEFDQDLYRNTSVQFLSTRWKTDFNSTVMKGTP